MKSRFAVGVLGAVLVGLLGCSFGADPGRPREDALRGGTLRVGSSRPFGTEPRTGSAQYALDPQFTYLAPYWELYRCCLLRTLLSYNGKPTAQGGTTLRPDLAADMPDVSRDGLEWVFHLKRGLHYAPPFEGTEITAGDIVRALEREFRLGIKASYSFYFTVIEGVNAFAARKVDSISGLEVPDPHTLVVHLTEPTGDLGFRFSMAATAPIPPGADHGHDGGYGRYLVSSGPYMIAGSEKLNFAVAPERQRPVSGWRYRYVVRRGTVEILGRESLTLVRNPSWDPRTDPLRKAYPDRVQLEMRGMPNSERQRNARKIDRGALDVILEGRPLVEQQRRYMRTTTLRERLHMDEQGGVEYSAMNLAVPPFDDVHVRRALNLALDRMALARIENRSGSFGPVTPTEHALPDSVEGDLLATYAPFPPSGDIAAAQSEMRHSRYDRNRDGRCDHPACKRVPTFGAAPEAGWLLAAEPLIQRDLARIGLTLAIRHATFRAFALTAGRPRTRPALSLFSGWVVDFPDGAGFGPVLEDPSETTNLDFSLLDATPQQLRRWGYRVRSVPSVAGKIGECRALLGGARTRCWAELDQLLMERIVPWVPHVQFAFAAVTSARVARYSFDQFATSPALDRIALRPGSR
jgi:peptide/nickel transport system substrate-binding protein